MSEEIGYDLHPAIRPNDVSDLRGGDISMIVDGAKLEETSPLAEQAAQYDVPDPEAVAEHEAAKKAEEATAEQVVTTRDEQSLNIANMATDNVPHFLVVSEGQEVCGGCGKAFPCDMWVGEIETRNVALSSGQPVPDEDKAAAVAELLGVPIEEARHIVLVSTPLNQLNSKEV